MCTSITDYPPAPYDSPSVPVDQTFTAEYPKSLKSPTRFREDPKIKYAHLPSVALRIAVTLHTAAFSLQAGLRSCLQAIFDI